MEQHYICIITSQIKKPCDPWCLTNNHCEMFYMIADKQGRLPELLRTNALSSIYCISVCKSQYNQRISGYCGNDQNRINKIRHNLAMNINISQFQEIPRDAQHGVPCVPSVIGLANLGDFINTFTKSESFAVRMTYWTTNCKTSHECRTKMKDAIHQVKIFHRCR